MNTLSLKPWRVNRRFVVALLWVAPCSPGLAAAAADVAKLHVFVDDKNTVFWPIDLPVWIRLAAAPEDGKESFLLQQIEMKNLVETKQAVNEGIKLEIPGAQFVRWFNHLTKNEVMYRFVADGGPPFVSIKLEKAPSYQAPDHLFFGKGLEAQIVARDDQSGVKEVFSRIDKQPFALYNSPLPLGEEKPYQVAFYANDRVGYVAKYKESDFIVDLSPPESMTEVKFNFEGTVFSEKTRIFLKSTDKLSGVDGIYYKFNNQESYQAYSGDEGIDLASLADGMQILNYYGEDKVKNREAPKELQFYLDKTAPAAAFTLTGDSYIGDKKRFISPRTRVRLDASDSQVKVAEIFYGINAKPDKTYQVPFTPAVNQGEAVLQYRAKDSLQNVSAVSEVKMFMDSEPPHTTHSIKGKTFTRDTGVIYIGPLGEIVLIATDAQSGVKRIEYQLNESPPATSEGPIKLPNEGRFLFRYWATDNVNNQEGYTPMLLVTDWTAPEIVETFSTESLGTSTVSETTKAPAYPVGTALNLAARDSASGLASIEYTLDSDKSQTYDGLIALKAKGNHVIRVRATDHVGNRSEKIIAFVIVDQRWKALSH